jgi:hypothetical protein
MFSFLHSGQTDSEVHPSYGWVLVDPSLGVKRQGDEATHSPLSSVEVKKNDGVIPPHPIRLDCMVLN